MKLTRQQQDIIDALRCMEWCEIPDLLAAADVASERSLRVFINRLRNAGYDIANRRGRASRGTVGAYSLRGTPSKTAIKALVFNNADATPKTVCVMCDVASVPSVMAWYGAFFAGDRYTVALDGRNVPMDINGEPVGEVLP